MVSIPWFVEEYQKLDREFSTAVRDIAEKALQPLSLDDKTKHLVVLALDIAKGAGEGVKVVARQAREAGASEQEIRDIIRLAYYVSGMDTIKTALKAFEE